MSWAHKKISTKSMTLRENKNGRGLGPFLKLGYKLSRGMCRNCICSNYRSLTSLICKYRSTYPWSLKDPLSPPPWSLAFLFLCPKPNPLRSQKNVKIVKMVKIVSKDINVYNVLLILICKALNKNLMFLGKKLSNAYKTM